MRTAKIALKRPSLSRQGDRCYCGYAVYAEAANPLLLPELIAALEEYAIPLPMADKISSHLQLLFFVDAVISHLRAFDPDIAEGLTDFEGRWILTVQETL